MFSWWYFQFSYHKILYYIFSQYTIYRARNEGSNGLLFISHFSFLHFRKSPRRFERLVKASSRFSETDPSAIENIIPWHFRFDTRASLLATHFRRVAWNSSDLRDHHRCTCSNHMRREGATRAMTLTLVLRRDRRRESRLQDAIARASIWRASYLIAHVLVRSLLPRRIESVTFLETFSYIL